MEEFSIVELIMISSCVSVRREKMLRNARVSDDDEMREIYLNEAKTLSDINKRLDAIIDAR